MSIVAVGCAVSLAVLQTLAGPGSAAGALAPIGGLAGDPSPVVAGASVVVVEPGPRLLRLRPGWAPQRWPVGSTFPALPPGGSVTVEVQASSSALFYDARMDAPGGAWGSVVLAREVGGGALGRTPAVLWSARGSAAAPPDLLPGTVFGGMDLAESELVTLERAAAGGSWRLVRRDLASAGPPSAVDALGLPDGASASLEDAAGRFALVSTAEALFEVDRLTGTTTLRVAAGTTGGVSPGSVQPDGRIAGELRIANPSLWFQCFTATPGAPEPRVFDGSDVGCAATKLGGNRAVITRSELGHGASTSWLRDVTTPSTGAAIPGPQIPRPERFDWDGTRAAMVVRGCAYLGIPGGDERGLDVPGCPRSLVTVSRGAALTRLGVARPTLSCRRAVAGGTCTAGVRFRALAGGPVLGRTVVRLTLGAPGKPGIPLHGPWRRLLRRSRGRAVLELQPEWGKPRRVPLRLPVPRPAPQTPRRAR